MSIIHSVSVEISISQSKNWSTSQTLKNCNGQFNRWMIWICCKKLQHSCWRKTTDIIIMLFRRTKSNVKLSNNRLIDSTLGSISREILWKNCILETGMSRPYTENWRRKGSGIIGQASEAWSCYRQTGALTTDYVRTVSLDEGVDFEVGLSSAASGLRGVPSLLKLSWQRAAVSRTTAGSKVFCSPIVDS